MSKNPDYDDQDLIHDHGHADPLAQIYTGLVSPDIENINEDAADLAEEAETEPDNL